LAEALVVLIGVNVAIVEILGSLVSSLHEAQASANQSQTNDNSDDDEQHHSSGAKSVLDSILVLLSVTLPAELWSFAFLATLSALAASNGLVSSSLSVRDSVEALLARSTLFSVNTTGEAIVGALDASLVGGFGSVIFLAFGALPFGITDIAVGVQTIWALFFLEVEVIFASVAVIDLAASGTVSNIACGALGNWRVTIEASSAGRALGNIVVANCTVGNSAFGASIVLEAETGNAREALFSTLTVCKAIGDCSRWEAFILSTILGASEKFGYARVASSIVGGSGAVGDFNFSASLVIAIFLVVTDIADSAFVEGSPVAVLAVGDAFLTGPSGFVVDFVCVVDVSIHASVATWSSSVVKHSSDFTTVRLGKGNRGQNGENDEFVHF
jgi:hypothetical protein